MNNNILVGGMDLALESFQDLRAVELKSVCNFSAVIIVTSFSALFHVSDKEGGCRGGAAGCNR